MKARSPGRWTWRALRNALRRRRWLVVIVAILSFLCGVEWLAAGHEAPPVNRLYREHPRRFWSLNPGQRFDVQANEFVHINDLGICAAQPGKDRADLTILLLGDSCVYGAGVPQAKRIDRYLEQYLRRLSGRDVRVYNGGCPGYSSFQGLDLLTEIGATIRPDVVVIGAFHADSCGDVTEDKLRLGGPVAGAIRTALWHSRAYRWLRDFMRGSEGDYTSFLSQTPRGTTFRVSEADTEKNLRRMADLARRQGAQWVLFVHLPEREERVLRPGEALGGHFQRFHQVGRNTGILMDAFGAWQRIPQKERQRLFWDTVHFNANGCQRFADELSRVFVESGIVKPVD